MSGTLTQIHDLFKICAHSETPKEALVKMLDALGRHSGARAARLFLLNIVDARFDCAHTFGFEDNSPIKFSSLADATHSNDVVSCLLNRRFVSSNRPERILVCQPIVRGDQILGAIELELRGMEVHLKEYLAVAAEIFATTYERARTLELFSEIAQPVYVKQDRVDFFAQLVLEARLASGMRFVAIRELSPDGKTLQCIAQDGFDSTLPLSYFNLSPVRAHTHFETAISKPEPVSVRDMRADDISRTSFDKDVYADVVSYIVIPILVSDRVVGTISFATSMEYSFSRLEIAGLVAIANAVGVAMSNYQNILDQEDQAFKRLQLAVLWNTVDVAQAVRHLVRKATQNSEEIVDSLRDELRARDQLDSPNKVFFNDLEIQFKEIWRNMDHLKNITQPPDRSESLVDLKQQWRDAYEMVRGRARYEKKQEIKFDTHGPSVKGKYKGELLKHAFVNLILNSQDAFLTGPKGADKRIDVYIEDLGSAAGKIRMRYVDNAGGVNPSQLRFGKQQLQRGMDIFTGGVTSKKQGSGWGLYLVRRFLDENGGSSNLIDNKGGVTFEIELPRNNED
jgi:signal transduction histidine kinase